MLGYFWKKLEKVLDALLEPFWLRAGAWTKDLSWQGRALLLVFFGLVALAAVYWSSLPLFYRTAAAFEKIATSDPAQIPLDSSLTFKVRETSRRLAEGLRAELNDPGSLDPPSAWTLAQLTGASGGMIKIKAEVVRAYFRDMEIAYNCWPETLSHPPNVAASGWVLFALAELNFPATEAEVRFFLKEQKRDGWWSIFQATDDEANASTFGTAWALIGLQSQLRRKNSSDNGGRGSKRHKQGVQLADKAPGERKPLERLPIPREGCIFGQPVRSCNACIAFDSTGFDYTAQKGMAG